MIFNVLVLCFQTLRLKPGIPIPVTVNPVLLEELAQLSMSHKPQDVAGFTQEMASGLSIQGTQSANDSAKDAGGAASAALVGRSAHSQKLQEFLLVLAICNTVVVARHPHHDMVSFHLSCVRYNHVELTAKHCCIHSR